MKAYQLLYNGVHSQISNPSPSRKVGCRFFVSKMPLTHCAENAWTA